MKTKTILEDLMTFYISLPNDYNKLELHNIINRMTSGNISLKNVIELLNKKITIQKSPQNKSTTLRENNIKFWEYVLNLFITHLKGV